MNSSPNTTGRILSHGDRADAATDETVEQRARELALINGRTPQNVTEEDRAAARDELAGRNLREGTLAADDDALGEHSSDPTQPRSMSGTQRPMHNDPDDQETAERLVLEGVDEAAHEQMLAARRESRPQP